MKLSSYYIKAYNFKKILIKENKSQYPELNREKKENWEQMKRY